MPVKIEAKGLDVVVRKMERLPQNIKRKRSMFKKVETILDRWNLRNFQSEGKFAQGGWPKLAAATIAARRRRLEGKRKKGHRFSRGRASAGYARYGRMTGMKILQDTGVGRASVRTRSTAQHAKIYMNDQTIGTGPNYMIMHHEGRGNLPVRKIIPEEKQVIRPVMKAATWHLQQAVKRAGL